MSENHTQPLVVIEGRAPLPAEAMPDGLPQDRTRQTELPRQLAELGIGTAFVEAQDLATYETPEQLDSPAGRIKEYTPYGATKPVQAVLEPNRYVSRLRSLTWEQGDPLAYQGNTGHNSAAARYALRTRSDLWGELTQMRLGAYGIETFTNPRARDWTGEQSVFVKPNDISDNGRGAGTRAQLVASQDLRAVLSKRFAGGAVLQRPEPLLAATELLDQLDIEPDSSMSNYLHAIRVFSLAGVTPAIELRLTNPASDIGSLFATKLHLLEPESVFSSLPGIAVVHGRIQTAFAERYGKNNYFAFDYIVRRDGSVKLVNALLRALTPNLPRYGEQASEAGNLALATVALEANYLTVQAISKFHTL